MTEKNYYGIIEIKDTDPQIVTKILSDIARYIEGRRCVITFIRVRSDEQYLCSNQTAKEKE